MVLRTTNLHGATGMRFGTPYRDPMVCVLVQVVVAGLHHGFGDGHFRVPHPKKSQNRGKNWSFSGHGPTPENYNIFFRVCINVG